MIELNIKTPKQAREGYCPFAASAENPKCLAQECMAWVWVGECRRKCWCWADLALPWDQEEEPPRPAEVPADWVWSGRSESDPEDPPGWWQPLGEAMAGRKGRCGMVPEPRE